MELILFLAPWIVLGAGVLFVAFSGGPGRARDAYLTRGNRGVRILMPLLYIALAIGVPAVVIAGRGEAQGGTGALAQAGLDANTENGKELFRQNCTSCHTLAAINARGVTGPNLDALGELDRNRVLSAIEIGGTGQKLMPAGLVEGKDAEDLADYVSSVAGR